MTDHDQLSLFGELDPVPVVIPPQQLVQWAGFYPTIRVQCMHCVAIVHARHGHGPIDIRTARRRRTSPDGELLLCTAHARVKHDDDVAAGLVPPPRRAARPVVRR